MATAAELLAGVSTGDDTTLVIDNYLRTINIPKRVTNLGVEHDDEVLFLNFKMPRYLDDTDLSKFSIRINYINANGDSDAYTVNEDKKVVGENFIKFSWLVGPTATAYKGTTKFNVCMKTMKTVDDQQVIDKEYNTTVASLPVLEGLEVDESIVTQYSDLIEQWREDIFGETDSEIQKIRDASQKAAEDFAESVAEVVATIPNEYAITSELAEEGVRTKADAIVNTADGTSISVSDCSNDHIRNLRVLGKTSQVTTTGTQLFNPYAEQNNSFGNATVENNGSRITVTGTYYVSWPLVLKAGVTYYINFNTVGPATNRAIRFEYPDKEITGTVTNPASFTPTKDTVSVYLYAGLGTEDTIIYENVQISEGSSALPWEPYSGGVASPSPDWPQDLVTIENPEIAIHGKNLIDCSDVTLDEVDEYYHTFDTGFEPIIGETYTLSMDVATNVFPFAINIGCGQTAYHSDMTPKISGVYSENGRVALTFVWWLTPTQLAKNYTKLYIRAPRYGSPTTFAATVSNVQLELGAKATEYEPYRKSQILDVPYVLPSVPVTSDGNFTDENGQQWVCDEIDFDRGVYIQNIQTVVLDGSENISREERSNNTYRYVIRQYGPVKVKPTLGGYCSHFKYNIAPIGANDVDNVVSLWTTGYPYCRCDSITSVEDMSTWLLQQYENGTPVTVMGVLDSPIETPLTTAELEAFKALYTNHPNTTVLNDSGAPMQLTYNVDTKIYLDSLPKATDEQVMDCVSAWLDSHFTSAEGVSF
jgi:hypothetical protein